MRPRPNATLSANNSASHASLRALITALICVALVGAVLIGVRFAEAWFLFPAPPPPAEPPVLLNGVTQTWFEASEIRVEAFLLPPERSEQKVPLIVYAHGNGELTDDWLAKFEPFRASGVAVLLVEYPGDGRSAGIPSEDSIQRALAAGCDWATSLSTIDAHRVVGYGSSLGGGAICAPARVRPLAAKVLESTFSSFSDLVAERPAPVSFFHAIVQNRFDYLAVLRDYQSPVLILHGDRDEMISLSHAHRLAAAADISELAVMHCGHNDCRRPWPTILKFLSKHGFAAGGKLGLPPNERFERMIALRRPAADPIR